MGTRRVSLRKQADAGKAIAPRVGSFRERLDWAWICARIRGRGVPESDVDDVAQVVLIAMSRAEKKLVVRPGQTLREARRATLRTIIRFRVADYRRDRARFYRMRCKLAWSDGGAVAPSVEELALKKERRTRLDAALEEMRQQTRCYEVVIAYGLEEAPLREVAAALGIPEGTASGRLRRGRAALRKTLEKWDDTERSAA